MSSLRGKQPFYLTVFIHYAKLKNYTYGGITDNNKAASLLSRE